MNSIKDIRMKLVGANVVPPDTADQHVTNLLLALARSIPFDHLLELTRSYRGYRDVGKNTDDAALSAVLQWIGDLRKKEGLPEAPASVNLRYRISGWDIQQTIRGFSDEEVRLRLDDVIKKIPQQPSTPAPAQPPSNQSATVAQKAPTCPKHNIPLKESKWGGWYCPQKIGEIEGKAVYCDYKIEG